MPGKACKNNTKPNFSGSSVNTPIPAAPAMPTPIPVVSFKCNISDLSYRCIAKNLKLKAKNVKPKTDN